MAHQKSQGQIQRVLTILKIFLSQSQAISLQKIIYPYMELNLPAAVNPFGISKGISQY